MTNHEILRPVYRIVVTAFTITHVILGIISIPTLEIVWPCVLALLLCLGAGYYAAYGRPKSLNLLRGESLVIVGITTLMAVLVNYGLSDGFPGYGWWNSGATEMILVALALRGQLPIAWAGLGLFAIAQSIGGTLNHVAAAEIVGNIVTPAMWIFFAAVTRWQIERNHRQIQLSEQKGKEIYQRQAEEYAYQITKDEWAGFLDGPARQALQEIIDNADHLTEEHRRKYELLELSLRDESEARIFLTDTLREALQSARAEGLVIDFNDIRNVPLPAQVQRKMEQELLQRLRQPKLYSELNVVAFPRPSRTAVSILVRPRAPGAPEQIDISNE